jgi:hypothetical protein
MTEKMKDLIETAVRTIAHFNRDVLEVKFFGVHGDPRMQGHLHDKPYRTFQVQLEQRVQCPLTDKLSSRKVRYYARIYVDSKRRMKVYFYNDLYSKYIRKDFLKIWNGDGDGKVIKLAKGCCCCCKCCC